MSLYEFLLFVHVLAAAVWVGALVFFVFLLELALRSDDRSLILRMIEYDDRLAPILYIPAVILVLTAGVGLVLDGPWSFGDGWIIAGIVLLLSAFVLGVGFLLPAVKRLRAAVDAAGVESAEVGSQLGRYRFLSWADAATLVVAVFVMTVKPF